MKHFLGIGLLLIAVYISGRAVICQDNQPYPRCSLDGSRIQPRYEVIVIEKDGLTKKFSCVLSVRIWLRDSMEEISSILVTDEATGKKIKSEDAFYVASEVVTTPYTGNRTHVFSQKSTARSHARHFKGRLVKNPFQAQKKKSVAVATYRTGSPNNPDFFCSSSSHPLSLPTNPAFRKKQNSFFSPQQYFARLFVGYTTFLDKPPQKTI